MIRPDLLSLPVLAFAAPAFAADLVYDAPAYGRAPPVVIERQTIVEHRYYPVPVYQPPRVYVEPRVYYEAPRVRAYAYDDRWYPRRERSYWPGRRTW